MTSRLNAPGVDVYQILENRKPSNLKPVQVPCVFGVHRNIQNQLSLIYHKDDTANLVVAIPTGHSAVTQQIFSATSDITAYINTSRGLALLSEETSGAWTSDDHYTVSIDTDLGATNLISITSSIDNIQKTLILNSTASSVTLVSSSSINYLHFDDPNLDLSGLGVEPGDLVEIDFDSTNKNEATDFSALTLSVTEVVNSNEFKATWGDNNSTWVDDTNVVYDLKTPVLVSVSGQVYLSYNARVISDTAQLIEMNSVQDAKDEFGVLEPENPLGFHTLMSLVGTDRTFYAMRVRDETIAAYESSLETLKTSDDAYYLVPTTESKTIQDLVTTHVNYMSEPEQRGERVMIASRGIPTYTTYVASAAFNAWPEAATTTLSVTTVQAAVIKPGHIFRPASSNTLTLSDGKVIDSIDVSWPVIDVAGTTVTMAGALGNPADRSITGAFTSRTYRGDFRARYVASLAEAVDNKRVIHVYPDQVKVDVTRVTASSPNFVKTTITQEETLDGTVAAAVLAAQASSLRPAQPMSGLQVAGINKVVGSNDNMSGDNLDVMAGGGNWILVNTRGGASVVTRHQLTTAVSDVNTREFSVVRAVDYAAKVFRAYLNPLVGKSIITDNFIKRVVKPVCHSAKESLIEAGVISQRSKILTISQDTSDPTRIVIEIDLEPLYPANYFTVKLFI